MDDQPPGPVDPVNVESVAAPSSRSRRDGWLLAAGAVSTVLVIWALARYAGSRAAGGAIPEGVPGAPASVPGGPLPSQEDLLRQNYNLMLQVRANDGDGRPMPVGAMLPRKMEFLFTGSGGQPYAQQFDRVGMWAVEIPAGTYTIAAAQPGLGKWKWKVTGDLVRPATGGGWTVTLKAGTMNPMVDLLLF